MQDFLNTLLSPLDAQGTLTIQERQGAVTTCFLISGADAHAFQQDPRLGKSLRQLIEAIGHQHQRRFVLEFVDDSAT